MIYKINGYFFIFLVEFGDEFQIGSLQILFDPLVDFAVHFRSEVVLPASRFTCEPNNRTVFFF